MTTITPFQQEVIRYLASIDDWQTRQEIAEGMGRRLYPRNIEKIEDLYQAGYIAKRIRPTPLQNIAFQYKYLPSHRPREAIVRNVLREYYFGTFRTVEEVALALGSSTGELSNTDRKHFTKLINEHRNVEARFDPNVNETRYRYSFAQDDPLRINIENALGGPIPE